ncbi:MAG: hypothetical protein M0007_15680, partial [Actinomycetota bacterium]|nr:hypothetical protein [Actinomycetota bacterium]
ALTSSSMALLPFAMTTSTCSPPRLGASGRTRAPVSGCSGQGARRHLPGHPGARRAAVCVTCG